MLTKLVAISYVIVALPSAVCAQTRPTPDVNQVSWPALNLPPHMLTNDAQDFWPCFSPDGKTLLFSRSIDGKHWELYVTPADGGASRPLTTVPLPVSAT